jgi:hypothetical protein
MKIEVIEVDPRLDSELTQRSLENAIRMLNMADQKSKFYTYDSNHVHFYQLRSKANDLRFGLELIKNRASRPNNPQTGCPIDWENVNEKGVQNWIKFNLNGRIMVALSNPFAFLCFHTTIASAFHEPQSWESSDKKESRRKKERAIQDVCQLASELPSFIVIFNASRESGASLPAHRHYQIFELPPGYGSLTIQQAAAKHHPAPIVYLGFDDDYPVYAARFIGASETVLENAVDFLDKWEQILGVAATANLIAVTENGEIALYVVLRNRLFRYAQGFEGILGSAEMAGFFILSNDSEFKAVQEKRFSFSTLWEMLEAVRPPEATLMKLKV